MFVSCSCLTCEKSRFPTMESAVEKIKELGFNVFDFDFFEGWQHIDPSEVAEDPDGWRKRLVPLIEDGDNIVISVNCGLSGQLTDPDPDTFEQCKREVRALFEVAEGLMVTNMTLQPGPVQEGQDHAEALDALKRHLNEIAQIDPYIALDISVEAHANSVIERPEDALNLMEDVYPDVGLTYDPSHFVMQGISLEETEPLLKHAFHVHVRNASEGNMQDTMDGGTVDFEWLVDQLIMHDYIGALSIEYFNDFDPDFENVVALRDRLVGPAVGAQAEWMGDDVDDLYDWDDPSMY